MEAFAAQPRALPPHRVRGRRRHRGPRPREGRGRPPGDPEAVCDPARPQALAARARPRRWRRRLRERARARARARRRRSPRRAVARRAAGHGARRHQRPPARRHRQRPGHRPGLELARALGEAGPVDADGDRPRGAGPQILVASTAFGNHLLVEAQKLGGDARTVARVELVDQEGPLALVAVDDPAFWDGLEPLPLAERAPAEGDVTDPPLAALGPPRLLPGHPAPGALRAARPLADEPPDPRDRHQHRRPRRVGGRGREGPRGRPRHRPRRRRLRRPGRARPRAVPRRSARRATGAASPARGSPGRTSRTRRCASRSACARARPASASPASRRTAARAAS